MYMYIVYPPSDVFLAVLQAKDMVSLVNKFAAKVEEKKGTLSEDEVSVLPTPRVWETSARVHAGLGIHY